MRANYQIITVLSLVTSSAGSALAETMTFTDAAAWQQAVGTYTTIGFSEFPSGTIITEQYASLGVHFTDGTDTTLGFGLETFPQDGWGLKGHIFQLPDEIRLTFDTPQRWIAVHFPGIVQIDLYRKGILINDLTVFAAPGGIGGFGGLISTDAFDQAVIWDNGDGVVFIDDLHFGVPAPGALGVFATAALTGSRRRRSG